MEEYTREQMPNNVSMSDSVSQESISIFNETRLNLEGDDPLYQVFPNNLQNVDIEKSINIADNNEVLEAILDGKMEKDGSSESEAGVTPVVTKEVEKCNTLATTVTVRSGNMADAGHTFTFPIN